MGYTGDCRKIFLYIYALHKVYLLYRFSGLKSSEIRGSGRNEKSGKGQQLRMKVIRYINSIVYRQELFNIFRRIHFL